MKLGEIMSTIESNDFFAELAIANDTNLFLRFARRKRIVRSLLKAIKNRSAQNRIATRVLVLLQHEYDPEYVRPFDTALAIYVWALNAVQSPLALTLAIRVSSESNLWWAKQVCRLALNNYLGRIETSRSIMNVGSLMKALPSARLPNLTNFEAVVSTATQKSEISSGPPSRSQEKYTFQNSAPGDALAIQPI